MVVLLLLVKTTNLDLVYTAIERVAPNNCNNYKVNVCALAYFVIFFFIFCVYQLCNYKNEAQATMTQGNTSCSCSCICTSIVLAFLITAFAALLILADTRLVLWLVDFIIGFTMFGWWTWWYCHIYKKGMLKQTSYRDFVYVLHKL